MSLVDLLVEDLISLPTGLARAAWGIYLGGAPVILADSVVSFEYRNEFSLATAPQEKGAFETYDKVSNPFIVRFVFAKGGSLADRQLFIDSIEALSTTLDLYNVVTPEKVYISCNIFHNSYRREASSGVGLIQYEVWAEEIRVTGTDSSDPSANNFQNTASPSSANAVSDGNLQTQDGDAGDALSLSNVA